MTQPTKTLRMKPKAKPAKAKRTFKQTIIWLILIFICINILWAMAMTGAELLTKDRLADIITEVLENAVNR